MAKKKTRPTKKKARPNVKAAKKKAVKKATPTVDRVFSRPMALVFFGPPGIGKTSLAARFPGAGFIIDPMDKGIDDLLHYRRVPSTTRVLARPETWKATLKAIDKAPGQGIQTLVLDSGSGFQNLCFAHHCREQFDGDFTRHGFYSYQQGPKTAAKTDWETFLNHLEQAREAGLSIIFICHSIEKNYSNPSGSDYDRYIPYLDKEVWQGTHRWAQAVFFMHYRIETTKKGPKTKVDTTQQDRIIETDWNPAFDAKNRLGLPSYIPMGDSDRETYANLYKELLKVTPK